MLLFTGNNNNDLKARVEASERRLKEFERLAKALVQTNENQSPTEVTNIQELKDDNKELVARCAYLAADSKSNKRELTRANQRVSELETKLLQTEYLQGLKSVEDDFTKQIEYETLLEQKQNEVNTISAECSKLNDILDNHNKQVSNN